MRRWAALVVTVLVVPLLAGVAPAQGASVTSFPLLSAGSGIALGPDGNLWVAEEFNDSVARLSPSGALLERFAVGDAPSTVAVGPGGRVWVAVTGSRKLTWFDATAPSPTAHDIATGPSTCGPVALVSGGDGRMYYSLPSDGTCNGGGSQLGSVADTGLGGVTNVSAGGGEVYDLAVASGKLFAPDFGGDVVRRFSLDGAFNVDSTITVATGSGPEGIAADGAGNLWVTEWNTGKVVRFPASQNNGSAQEIPLTGGTLANPYGIVASGDGRIYVAGQASANLVRISADGVSSSFEALPATEPHAVVDGPDGELYVTDQRNASLLRFVDAAPRASAAAVKAPTTTAATASSVVDPRGNETRVFFDYGATTAYGRTAGPYVVPASAAATNVAVRLTGLKPGTTYHVRVRATNAEGTTTTTGTTFASRSPRLAARTKLRYRSGPTTVITQVSVSRLGGGETITIRCQGRGCLFKTKVVKRVKKGIRSFGNELWKARGLRQGSKVVVLVTKPKAIGRSTTLTVRAGKKPKIVQSCLRPGTTRPTSCS
ncbi:MULTISPECIES: hypothetical protein [unclassified Nocardioides]|uniref:virginiamycin B lyase family protein n=1 Tax=unclassified Nocardioides TaxID=2615069 RepID=UPI000AE28DCA|nr:MULTISPECIES: hypothetical protein [unclassified Nocardioides]